MFVIKFNRYWKKITNDIFDLIVTEKKKIPLIFSIRSSLEKFSIDIFVSIVTGTTFDSARIIIVIYMIQLMSIVNQVGLQLILFKV